MSDRMTKPLWWRLYRQLFSSTSSTGAIADYRYHSVGNEDQMPREGAFRRAAEVTALREKFQHVRSCGNQMRVNMSVSQQHATTCREIASRKQPGWLAWKNSARLYDELVIEFGQKTLDYQKRETGILKQLADLT